jgi:FAD/FMN-containing dehydrogenase
MSSLLRETFAGEIVLPGNADYDSARAVWNGMIDRRPAIVLRPTNPADVVAALGFAREQELDIAVKSGGHSIPGLSTCDDGAVIDLSRMRGVEVDPSRRVAHVNGGSLLGELDEQAQSFGLVCPVGVVGHTGVAGLTLGGGMGRLQRRFGLTIDNLLAVELVTSDGRLVRASEEENEELFWGLRGAGANFGIATSFEFLLHPLDGAVTHGRVVHPIDRATELASIFRETEEATPDELWLGFGLGLEAGDPVATVHVLHCGSAEDAARDLAKLRAFGPAVDSIETKPYLVPQGMNDEAMRWGHRFYMKSGFLPGLDDELIDLLVGHMERVPDGTDGGVSFWAMGRAISEVPEDATAFTGRDAAFWIAAEILWDDEELDEWCRAWTRALMDDVLPFTSAGRYVNDVAEAGEDLGASIYGAAKYERLVAVKRAWDPENVFRLNQNVRP